MIITADGKMKKFFDTTDGFAAAMNFDANSVFAGAMPEDYQSDIAFTLELQTSNIDYDLNSKVINNASVAVFDYTGLLYGQYWNNYGYNNPMQGVTFITYSFQDADALPDPASLSHPGQSVFSFSEEQRDLTRGFIEQFSDNSGIVFIEVENGGALNFTGVSLSGTGGFANYASSWRDRSSEIYIDDNGFSLGRGSEIFGRNHTILHEIGHALGLKHPHEPSGPDNLYLDESVDSLINTVMSYNSTGVDNPPLTLQEFDLQAIEHIYGANIDLGAAGITHSWDEALDRFTVDGSAADNVITGTIHDNILSGHGGNDILLGGGGDDTLNGGDGDDLLIGVYGNDTFNGGAGNDTIDARYGDNIVNAGAGDDLISIGRNSVEVFAGAGHDVIDYTERGNHVVDGGAGYDIFRMSDDFQGQFSLFNITLISIEEIAGSDGDDTFRFNSTSDVYINPSHGLTINGGFGYDTFYYWTSGSIENLIFESIENLNFFSYPGTVQFNPGQLDSIENLSGPFAQFEHLAAGASDLSTNIESGLSGYFYGYSDGDNSINVSGADSPWYVIGGHHSDDLIGGSGGDYIEGGGGADKLTGGAGRDVFIFLAESGLDRITDFSISEDFLAFGNNPYIQMSTIFDMMTQFDGYVMLNFSAGHSVRIDGISIEDLTAGNFRIGGEHADGTGPYRDPADLKTGNEDTGATSSASDVVDDKFIPVAEIWEDFDAAVKASFAAAQAMAPRAGEGAEHAYDIEMFDDAAI